MFVRFQRVLEILLRAVESKRVCFESGGFGSLDIRTSGQMAGGNDGLKLERTREWKEQ